PQLLVSARRRDKPALAGIAPLRRGDGFGGAVELVAGAGDLGLVAQRPIAKRRDRLQQIASERGQAIFDPRRNGGEDGAGDQPVPFEPAQRQRQHALRNAANRPAQFVKAQRPAAEPRHHKNGPLVADARQYVAHGAAIGGQMLVSRFHGCAFLAGALSHLFSPSYYLSLWGSTTLRFPPLSRIAVIVGSNRRDSINRKLAQALVRLGAGRFAASFARIDDLPIYNQDNEGNLPPEVVRFKNELARADGVLIVTPEHDRSIPAALKNAIDWGARPWARTRGPASPLSSPALRPARLAALWRSSICAR